MIKSMLGATRIILECFRRLVLMLAGIYGLWLCIGGLMSVLMTGSHSFAPPMWTELVLGAAILAGSVFLWRERAQSGTGRNAHAPDERRSGARD